MNGPTLPTHSVEHKASIVLRIGLWLSASLMVLGLLMAAPSGFRIIVPVRSPSMGEILRAVVTTAPDPVTVLYTGLLFLMFTPILRVATAVVGFAADGDRKFFWVSSLVLALLAAEILYSVLM